MSAKLLFRNVVFSLLLAGVFVAQKFYPAVLKNGALWSDYPAGGSF
jgi:hypothetical protein